MNRTKTPRPLLRAIERALARHTMFVLAVIFGVGLIAVLWYNQRQHITFVQETAQDHAAIYSQAISEFRALYTSEVVHAAREHGMTISHDYEEREGAIPLPATLSMLLGNRIDQKGSGVRTFLYSAHPFPWREEDGGLRDAFSEDAWRELNANPSVPFSRLEEYDGKRSLRHATADVMKPACVNCHNDHPETPRSDWQVGDVRGILEVVYPLEGAEAVASTMTRSSSFVLAGFAAVAMLVLATVLTRLRQATVDLEDQVEARTAELVELSEEIASASRIAGMAEVATGVLHDVGNAINSVNVSASLATEALKRSAAKRLIHAAELLDRPKSELTSFLTEDPKGRLLPEYIARAGRRTVDDQHGVLDELSRLTQHLDHVKRIIAAQQVLAKTAALITTFSLKDAIASALSLSGLDPPTRIEVEVRIDRDDEVISDRAKILQVLVNLLSNGRHAVQAAHDRGGRITVVVSDEGEGRTRIVVTDDGVGIAQDDLKRLFVHGFTTKPDGHGFGLHSAALAAKSLQGSLEGFSEGKGRGATFVFRFAAPATTSKVLALSHSSS